MNTFGSCGARSAVTFDAAAAHVMPAALEDQHHVVGGAAAGAGEHRLHRPRRQVAAAAVGRAVHRQQVAAAGLGDERHAVGAASSRSCIPCCRSLALRYCDVQQRSDAYTQISSRYCAQHRALDSLHAARIRLATDCLLHLLHWWIQPKAAMPWAFFLAAVATASRDAAAYDAAPQSSAAGDTKAWRRPPASHAPKTRPARKPALADYLQKILTARVYDVAIEIAARAGAAASRARLGNQVLLKREDSSRCSASSCAAPTTRWRTSRRRQLARGVICASAGNHAQGVALAARAARLPGGDRDAGDHAAAQGRRRARARRRGRAARRQLLRRLRARARARGRARPDLRPPVRRPRRDRRPGHDRDGDPAPAPGADRRDLRRRSAAAG